MQNYYSSANTPGKQPPIHPQSAVTGGGNSSKLPAPNRNHLYNSHVNLIGSKNSSIANSKNSLNNIINSENVSKSHVVGMRPVIQSANRYSMVIDPNKPVLGNPNLSNITNRSSALGPHGNMSPQAFSANHKSSHRIGSINNNNIYSNGSPAPGGESHSHLNNLLQQSVNYPNSRNSMSEAGNRLNMVV